MASEKLLEFKTFFEQLRFKWFSLGRQLQVAGFDSNLDTIMQTHAKPAGCRVGQGDDDSRLAVVLGALHEALGAHPAA
jgi:hypothetical protein